MRRSLTIDVSPAVHHRAGLGRYASELVEALVTRSRSFEIELFYAESETARPEGVLSSLPTHTSRLGYKPWRLQAMASYFLRRPLDKMVGKPALFHATDHLLPHLNAQTVFTLHDLIFEVYPQHHKRYNHLFLSLMMPRFLKAASHVITVSEHSKQDAIRLYGIPDEKMTVIYEAADAQFRPLPEETLASVRARYALPEQFILHVGTIEPRKNLSRLLESFALLKREHPALKLVLVGKKGWLYEPFFEQLAASGLAEEVIFPGFVAEAELPSLYNLATLFVFPSLYEGFGLPPLEALACGTPVVCSHASSLPEVVGDAALLVPPDDLQALTRAIQRILEQPELQRELRHRGPRQAARFSWERAAGETLAVYERVLASQPST